MRKLNINFETVELSEPHISALYDLLSLRMHGISHNAMPSFSDHVNFVANHPYRAWFFVRSGGRFVGTLNLNNDNTVGLNLIPGLIDSHYLNCIEFIKSNFEPLPEIKSVRAGFFAINVAPRNKELIDKLTRINRKILQITYNL